MIWSVLIEPFQPCKAGEFLKILEGCYFPRCNFLEAQIPQAPQLQFRCFFRVIELGGTLCFLSNFIPCGSEIELVDTIASRNGLVAALEEGFRDGIFQMDNQTLFTKLRNGVILLNQMDKIISTHPLPHEGLRGYLIQGARRFENCVAQNIANQARSPGLTIHSNPFVN